jgi:tetratricopeptide (TPR) repeat protein
VGLTIQQALQQGVAAHKLGQLQEAERMYRAILQIQPNHPDANHNLGILAVTVGKAIDALSLFKNALEANPRVEQFWLSYIDTLMKVDRLGDANEILKQAKKHGVAAEKLKVFKEVIELKQTPIFIHTSESIPSQEQIKCLLLNYQQGNLAEAEKLALSFTQEYPKHQLAWKVLAAVLWKTGRKFEALNANKTAVSILPRDVEALNNLGNMLQELGKLDDAEATCMQAIKLKPDFAEAHNNLGNTLKGMGRLEEATTSYSKAVTFKPDFAEAYNNLGNILHRLDRLVEAEACYAKAVALKPDFAEAHNNFGNLLLQLCRFEEAEASYAQATIAKPLYSDAHNNLGVAQQALHKFKEAEVSFKKAISLKPDFPRAHYSLGIMLQGLDRLADAEASFAQVIRLKPDYINAHTDMLTCLYLMGKKSLFFEQLDYLITQDKPNSVVGSLTCRSFLRFGEIKPNIFCHEPIQYVRHVNLKSQYNFKEIFVKFVMSLLTEEKRINKIQPLLSNGYQTSGNLFDIENNFIDQMQKAIRLEIENYKVSFASSKEGFIKKWPTEYRLNGWIISMKSGGKLHPHIHQNGWLSGSIYINVPPKNKTDSGNLVVALGKDIDVINSRQNSKKIIDVITGSMVLFPASLMHHTIPFESEEDRIVLAFDVIPKSQ